MGLHAGTTARWEASTGRWSPFGRAYLALLGLARPLVLPFPSGWPRRTWLDVNLCTICHHGGPQCRGWKRGLSTVPNLPNLWLVSAPLPAPQVAEVCVAALTERAANNKVVEVIAKKDAPSRTMAELFESVTWL